MTMRKKRDSTATRSLMKRLTLAVVVAMVFCIGLVANAHALESEPVPPATVTPEEAKAILMRMGEFMSKLQSFSVEVRDTYDTYQTTGQKIEYGETRKITMARPDQLRIDIEESDGNKQVLTIDSKAITLASQPANVFAQTASPGNLDASIVYFVRDLQMRLPFAVLLISNSPAEMRQRVTKLDYVEKTSLYGAPAHHLAGRTESVDFQVWITDGDKPVPQRLVITYTKEKGQPQFRAQFSNWNLAPEAPASLFTFTPPPGAHQISFLAQLPRSAASTVKPVKGSKSKKSGGQK